MPFQIDIRNLNQTIRDPLRIFGSARAKCIIDVDRHMYQSAGGAAATANGDPIGVITDLSGNANHFLQTTGGNKPSRVSNALGYYPAARFDGISSFMGAGAFLTQDQGFVMMVITLKTALVSNATMFGTADTSVSTKYIRLAPYTAANNSRVYQRNADTLDQVNLASGTVALNTPMILTIGSDSSTYFGNNNGTALTIGTVGSGANNGDWAADTGGLSVTTIGCHRINSNSAFLEFDLFYAIFVDGPSTLLERDAVREYLRFVRFPGLIY